MTTGTRFNPQYVPAVLSLIPDSRVALLSRTTTPHTDKHVICQTLCRPLLSEATSTAQTGGISSVNGRPLGGARLLALSSLLPWQKCKQEVWSCFVFFGVDEFLKAPCFTVTSIAELICFCFTCCIIDCVSACLLSRRSVSTVPLSPPSHAFETQPTSSTHNNIRQ